MAAKSCNQTKLTLTMAVPKIPTVDLTPFFISSSRLTQTIPGDSSPVPRHYYQ
ncbi:hypothetical protein RND71_005239 [Anisodus tanguticus]|uniref:Uncharacterized protein n=1 Tax=Anisodus tanguticus TaxID=243964 RepID=A0AAE1SR58_9SOLA|nr:hypothetical protein RND71_005239 [Anisodus tanguticus]